MGYDFFARNARELKYEWNKAKASDWLFLKRGFVASYLEIYMSKDDAPISHTGQEYAQYLWEQAKQFPPEQAKAFLVEMLIKPLQFYLAHKDTLLRNELEEFNQYFAQQRSDIDATKKRFIHLYAVKSYFEHIFDQEQKQLNEGHSIEYLILRYHDHPIAFFTCELSYTGYAYARYLSISPPFNRIGLGQALLTELSEHYPDSLGIDLYARQDNKGALAFYEKCGFTKFKKFDFHEPFPDAKNQDVLHFPKSDAADKPEEYCGFRRKNG